METKQGHVGNASRLPPVINSFAELAKALRTAAAQDFGTEEQHRMNPLERHVAEYLSAYLELALRTTEIPELKHSDLYEGFAYNIVKGWIYLCTSDRQLASQARSIFKTLRKRGPANVLDVAGGKATKDDGELLVKIVEKSIASIRLPDALRVYLSTQERTLRLKIDEFIDSVYRHHFNAPNIVAGRGSKAYYAAGSVLLLKQEGDQVELVFKRKWRPFSKKLVVFAGDVRKVHGGGLKLRSAKLPLGVIMQLIDAFIAKYKMRPRDLEAIDAELWRKAHGPAIGFVRNPNIKPLKVPEVAIAA